MLVTFLVSATVAVVLVAVSHTIVDRTTRSVVGRVLDDRVTAVVQAVEDGPSAGTPPSAVLGPGTAVYVDGRLVAGSVPPSLQDTFDRLSTTDRRRTTSVGEQYRVLAVPAREEAAVVVVAAEPLGPYERDEQVGLAVAGGAGVVMVLLASVVAALISRRALRPVRQMADAARSWSEHDLDRRFDLGPPSDELRALGQVLDELLDDVADAIRAEQRLSAEMAHELRSPLTTVRATVELLAARADLDEDLRDDLATIEKACASMSSTITVLLDEARGRTRVPREMSRADDLVRALAGVADERLVLDLPAGLELRAPAELVARILAPMVENGLRLARTVTVTATADGQGVDVVVSDDGPGVPAALADRVFEPGVTGGDGAGLGLALARRLARGAGGDIRLRGVGGGSGAAFVVRLPGRIRADG